MSGAPYEIPSNIFQLPPDTINGTDGSNARLFLHLFGENIRYVPDRKKWLCWNGRFWQYDEQLMLDRWSDQMSRTLYRQVADMAPGKERTHLASLASRLENIRIRSSMLTAARHHRVVMESDLNANPMLLNCANGTLNLDTGMLLNHSRDDLITYSNEIEYDPDWIPWNWKRFLKDTFCEDEELISYIQRLVGYSLTGLIREQIFMICWGSGANGKTVFLNTILKLVGPLGMTAMPDLLLMNQRSGHPCAIAELSGRRMVQCHETGDGRRFDEAQVKYLTGGDSITARRMYESQITFRPTHKLWLGTNYRPVVKGTDFGVWRRIVLIPFLRQFTDTSTPRRRANLEEVIHDELPGVLSWALEGCLLYRHTGLGECTAVSNATSKYRSDMDVISGWIADCCEVNETLMWRANNLYKSYQDWCQANGETADSQKSWGAGMLERGFERLRRSEGYYWKGIRLLNCEGNRDC